MPDRANHRRCCVAAATLLAGLCLLAGCHWASSAGRPLPQPDPITSLAPWDSPHLLFPERLDLGYTLVLPGMQVLPGIGCDSSVEHGIVVGLKNANVPAAVELHDWTGNTLRPVYNLRNLEHSRAEARKIAAKVLLYQERYPGRPVHLIGYSGGGAIAVLALEALPPDHNVTSAILLAPTLASDYDLRGAIGRTEQGIRNFYSPLDAPILMVLLVGTTEGQHTLAAGTVGFQAPPSLDAAQQPVYQARLSQREYGFDMLWDGHSGGHLGWASPAFVAHHVAPLVDPGRAD